MTTRSTTQRVAAGLLAGSRARWATSANTHDHLHGRGIDPLNLKNVELVLKTEQTPT
jgi:hypothetical protein